jgi:hypothetical protein
VFFAVIQYVFVFAIREIVSVLNAYDRDNLLSMFDFSYRNFGKTDMSNLALVLEFLECAQCFLGRNFWIDAMQLVEIDTSSFKRRRLISTHCWMYSGRPTGAHRSGPGRVKPPFVAMTRPGG